MVALAACVSPAPREAWKALLGGTEDALAFQTPEWTDCVCAMGRYKDASRLYEFGVAGLKRSQDLKLLGATTKRSGSRTALIVRRQ